MLKSFNAVRAAEAHSSANFSEPHFFHIGWLDYQKRMRSYRPSSFRAVGAIVMAFFIMISVSFAASKMLDLLLWQAEINNAWWGQSFIEVSPSPFGSEEQNYFINSNENYLGKPVVLRASMGVGGIIRRAFGVLEANAASSSSISWQGALIEVSPRSVIRIEPGRAITVEAAFKNTGTKTWKNSGTGFVSINVSRPYYHKSVMEHEYWFSSDQPAKLLETSVSPGGIGHFRFALNAPTAPGTYKEYFILSSEGVAWIKGDELEITFIIGDLDNPPPAEEEKDIATLEERIVGSEDSGNNTGISEIPLNNSTLVESTSTETLATSTPFNESIVISEPIIRVGLYKPTDPVIIEGSEPFFIERDDGSRVSVPALGRVVAFFDTYTKRFLVSGRDINEFLSKVRLVPKSSSGIFTIVNYQNLSKQFKNVNDNRFRGTIEVLYGEKSGAPWVVNELLMEDYLSGLVETSNASPIEYHKAIAVAARTYALWHILDGEKHRGNGFTVDAVWDQVYRGYSSEVLLPTYTQAVRETEGVIVTYRGKVAITPYFAQSNGRTKSWSEVWFGKKKPWLVSVSDPTNAGLKLFGHGVGLSARGALIQASKQKKTFDKILKYYYTGVSLERFYKRGTLPSPDVITTPLLAAY